MNRWHFHVANRAAVTRISWFRDLRLWSEFSLVVMVARESAWGLSSAVETTRSRQSSRRGGRTRCDGDGSGNTMISSRIEWSSRTSTGTDEEVEETVQVEKTSGSDVSEHWPTAHHGTSNWIIFTCFESMLRSRWVSQPRRKCTHRVAAPLTSTSCPPLITSAFYSTKWADWPLEARITCQEGPASSMTLDSSQKKCFRQERHGGMLWAPTPTKQSVRQKDLVNTRANP